MNLQPLNELLRNKIHISIQLTFIILLILLFINRKLLFKQFKDINKKNWLILGIIFLLGLALRLFTRPILHIMYIDEMWYMKAARNMLETGLQQEYPKSIGWPYILKIAFSIFGTNNYTALYTSVILGSLTIILLFLFLKLITKNTKESLIGTFIFTITPIHILWSSSAETNICSLFFILLTAIIFLIYKKTKTNSMFYLLCAALCFTAQIRPENYILIPLFLISELDNINLKKTIPVILIAILSISNFIQIAEYQTSTNWAESDSGIKQTRTNWNIYNLVNNSINYGKDIFSYITIFFLIIGVIYYIKNKKKESKYLITYFVLFWIIYFSSWFQTIGGRSRFYLTFLPITIIFISKGINIISRKMKINHLIILAILVILITPQIISVHKEYVDNEKKLDLKVLETIENDIPKNCRIIMDLPSILDSTNHLKVIKLTNLLNNKTLNKTINQTECILFFENNVCNLDPKLKKNCKYIKENYNLTIFKEYSLNNLSYELYLFK